MKSLMFYKIGTGSGNGLFWSGSLFSGWQRSGKNYSLNNLLEYLDCQKEGDRILESNIHIFNKETGENLKIITVNEFIKSHRKDLLLLKKEQLEKKLSKIIKELNNVEDIK